MTDLSRELLQTTREIRNWIRAAAHGSVRKLLEDALPDDKAREAYQMTNGDTSIDTIRTHCKMSPNDVSAMQQRCVSFGLMEVIEGNRRRRLFDLSDFGLLPAPQGAPKHGGPNGKRAK